MVEWAKAVLRGVLILLIFAALPWGLAEMAVSVLGEARSARVREALRIKHEKVLAQLNLVDDQTQFVAHLVRATFSRMKKHGPGQGRKDARALERLLPEALEFFFFDGSGRLLPEVSSQAGRRKLLETCYQVIGELAREGKPSPERLGMLRELWKMSRVESLIHYPDGKPMPIGEDSSAGFSCFGFASEPTNPGVAGYLAILHPSRFPEDLAPLSALKVASRHHPGIQFGWVDFDRTPALFYPRKLAARPALATAVLKALSSYNTGYADEDILLTLVQRKRNGSFLAVQRLPAPFGAGWIWLVRCGFLFWGGLVLARALSGRTLLETRISGRIVGLFLFAVGLPAILLLLGVFRGLEDHIRVQQETLERSMRGKIRQFDERFPLELIRIENQLRKLKTLVGKPETEGGGLQAFEKVRKERSITDFTVVDADGRAVWSLRRPGNSAGAQRQKIGQVMGREILKRLNKVDSIDGGTLVSESVSSLVGNLTEAGNWELFQRNLGQFTPFTLGDEGCFMLFDAVANRLGVQDRVFCAVLFRDRVESQYFRKHRRAFERQPDLTWRVNLWARFRLSRSVYSRRAEARDTEEIGRAVESQRSAIRKIVDTPRGRELLIGQLGQNMQGFIFVARAPLGPLERRIERLWALAACLVGLLVLATLVVGFFLSEQLLVPIQGLSRGIQAIRDRDFSLRIPVASRDELGEVSALMNQVMEGMQDLSVARAIQENLFPRDEVRLATLAVFGQSRTMTDVGGDYFDYVALPDGHLFGVVGDVSGHGVSAALIMGMAKCYFTVQYRQEVPLDTILTGFNQYLFRTIKRMKMMTLILFRWDAASRTLQFGNAGHVSPVVLSGKNRQVEEVSMPCMPLGVSIRAQFRTRDLVLQPGDAVFLCTDGFPETKNPQDELLGYGIPAEWFGAVGEASPREVVESLFRRLDSFREGAPVADDVTMICLRAL